MKSKIVLKPNTEIVDLVDALAAKAAFVSLSTKLGDLSGVFLDPCSDGLWHQKRIAVAIEDVENKLNENKE